MRPKVLHIYKDYWPPVVGGVEKTIHRLCNGLRHDFDPEVLIVNDGPETVTEIVDSISVRRAACRRRIASAPLSAALVREIGKSTADILHFHLPMPTAVIGRLLTRSPGKVVVTWHSDIVRQWWALWAYGPFLRRFLRRHAEAVMPTSPNYITSSRWLRGIREKCVPVPLGIEPEPYDLTEIERDKVGSLRRRWGNRPTILFVGQFRQYKGLPFLVAAMQHIDADCLLIGDGPLRPKIEKLVRSLRVGDRVRLLGRLSDREVIQHLHACDLFCLPSHQRSEAFGLVQVEAMMCGKPVVSCDLDTGVPFVNQHQQTGLLVRPADHRALADAIALLLRDDHLRHRLGQAARERALREFTAPRMCARVAAVYRRVLGLADGDPPV